MSTKISDLPSATSLTGTEEIPIVQTGTTKKTTIGAVKPSGLITTKKTSNWSNPTANQYNTITMELNDNIGSTFSFDSTNSRIVANSSCKILISATVTIDANTTPSVRIRKNGNELSTMSANIQTTGQICFCNIYASLSANDYIDIAYYSGTTADKVRGYRFYMSVVEITNGN